MKPANVLKIDSLGKDWTDKDVILLHACFQLLQDCVEKEAMFEMWGKDTPEREQAKRELRQLYRWWLKRKKKPCDGFLSRVAAREHDEDTVKLIRLIELRRHLWT